MLRLHHSSVLRTLPSLGLITVLALLCLSSFTTASPVRPPDDGLKAKRAPIPGSVNSTPGPLLVANEQPDGSNPPPNPPLNPPPNSPPNSPPNPQTNPLPIPLGTPRLPTIASISAFDRMQGINPVPVCEGKAPTDRSLYPSNPIADRWAGHSLEALCRERDPGPNCACVLNEHNLQVDLQCFLVGHWFPDLDRDWHTSGVMQVCKTKCHCPHIPAEQIPPSSPRTSFGLRPPSLGYRPSRAGSQDLESIVKV